MVLGHNKCLKLAESIVSFNDTGCSGPAPHLVPFNIIYSTPHVSSTMPEETPFHFPECSCWTKFTSDSWRLKHIKLHNPELLQVACHKNLTIRSAPWCVEPTQHREFHINKDSVEYFDVFPYLEHIESITDSESQPPPPPLWYMQTYPSAGTPLSDYITPPWEGDTQSCLETTPQNNAYFQFVTRGEFRYIQCGMIMKGMKTYYDNGLKGENTALCFRTFKKWECIQKLVASMPDNQALWDWELHTLADMRWNDKHQWPIKYLSRNILTSMRWLMERPAYAEHPIYAPQRCFNSNTISTGLCTEMQAVDWRRGTQGRRGAAGYQRSKRPLVNAQSGGYTASLDLHVRRNTPRKFCWRQEEVACTYVK